MKHQSEEQMSPVRNLAQKAGWYHCRLAVPRALQPFVGKRELWTALNTEARSEAIRRLPRALAAQRDQLEAARTQAQAVLTKPVRHGRPLSPPQLAAAHYEQQMRFDDELRNSDHRYSLSFVDGAYIERLRRVVKGAANNQECQDTVGWIAEKYQRVKNLRADFGTPEWREALRALAVAELESLARAVERDDDDFTGKPSHPLLTEKPEALAPAQDPLSTRIIGDDSTRLLSAIVTDFVKERRASPQTDYETRLTVRWFEECLGEELPVYKITRPHVHTFKKMLLELPSNSTKRFPGMSVPAAIKANKLRTAPFPRLNPRTINEKYLSRLHALFAWCVRSDVIPDNPAAGIKVEAVKSKKPPRIPFTPGDLSVIFSPKRFDRSKPFDEMQWALLSALFSGARASELAQLKLDSIIHQCGCLTMTIEEETKTETSQRVVPVHSTLVALGFEDRVNDLRTAGATHFFPDWYRHGMEAKDRARKRGKETLNQHFPRFIPRSFNNTYLPALGIEDPRKKFHSLRHTFKTGLRNCGVDKAMRDDLCGHEDNSAGAAYLHGHPIEAMKEAIEKLRFDGFTLV